MNDESAIKEILTFLGAFPAKTVRESLKVFSRAARETRLSQGWKLWTGAGYPAKPHEWRQIGNAVYYRMPPPADEQRTVASVPRKMTAAAEAKSGGKICPDCGAEAFSQAICPACAKGKAGIRRMWICGEHSDHIFYTE